MIRIYVFHVLRRYVCKEILCIQILSQRRLPKHCLINTDFLLLVTKLKESDGSQISPVPTFPAHPETLKPGR